MASISLPCPKCALVPRILKAGPCLVGSVGFSASSPAPDGRRLPVLKAQVREVLPLHHQFYSFVQDTMKWFMGLGQLASVLSEVKQISVDSSPNSTTLKSKKVEEEDVFKNDVPKEPVSKEPVSEAVISAFMDEATRLIMLVDTSDVAELQLKHDEFELVIRKKEALTPPTPPPAAPIQYAPYPPPQYAMAPPPPPPTAAVDPAAGAPAPAAATPAALPAPKSTGGGAKSSLPILKSPMAGTFYRKPNPTEKPFVEVGQKVKKGDIVCIIEAMKMMNEIEADRDGTVVEFLIEDGKPIGLGMPILTIQP
ncbi:hypothetical protein LUZ61_001659 [Rhynchospora tenuis]|uniref:Biotin carboxyl carrier protein of acetyl-CoA carboxylase n=1 Tax=Rhynchospora tenuis TaxID=198213 RepID=A0AAD5ZHE8_9POAL|nr:hypothetical protein LUZ61_001659 [Rhynchospora tenuis]